MKASSDECDVLGVDEVVVARVGSGQRQYRASPGLVKAGWSSMSLLLSVNGRKGEVAVCASRAVCSLWSSGWQVHARRAVCSFCGGAWQG